MLKTYITTVPLQGKLDPMLYQRERAEAPTATCFPIVQVIRDTLEPGDTVRLLAIRQENADTARNYQRLLEELAQLGIAEAQVELVHLPEDQRPETLIGLCRDLVDGRRLLWRGQAGERKGGGCAALRYGSAVPACRAGGHHAGQQDRRRGVPSADLDEPAPGGLNRHEE